MRWRNSCGRMSPTRWAAPFVWPLTWQSKQVTPRWDAPTTVLRLVELLLRERSHQEAQPLDLLRVEDPVEELVEVLDRHQLALRDVPQVGPGGEEDRRRELGKEVLGDVEVEIEAGEVALLLLLDFVDVELREDHPSLGVVRVGERLEAAREELPLADLVRLHRPELVPRDPGAQPHPDAVLQRLAAGHRLLGRAVGEVVALGEQVRLLLHDPGLCRAHPGHDGGEVLLDDHGRVARSLLGRLLSAHDPQQERSRAHRHGGDRRHVACHMCTS